MKSKCFSNDIEFKSNFFILLRYRKKNDRTKSDTGELVEDTKVYEIIILKELGKLVL